MQYTKSILLASSMLMLMLMLMLIVGCHGLSVSGPLLSVEGIVVLPEPAPPQPIVVWYQTAPACCYVFMNQQWQWGYHHWHHHHYHGRPHHGYEPRNPIPRHYVYPPRR